MSKQIVFITGGSGHLGFPVVVDTLKAGYSVRAAVRSEQQADGIKNVPSIQKLQAANRLNFVIIKDMLVNGAYDEAVQGADFIIHVASPISSSFPEGGDYDKHFIQPAVQGTLNILSAAQKAASVKRVVITSSVAAIIPWADATSGKSTTVFNEKSRTKFLPGPYENDFQAYAASKTNALNRTEVWLKEEKPTFDIVHIFPGYIIGRNELVTDIKNVMDGTNKTVLGPVLGGDAGYIPGTSIHLDDVALAHVVALQSKVPGNQGYILSSGGLAGTHWEDAKKIIVESFPKAVSDGRLSKDGKIVTAPTKIDEARSEEVLGFKFKDFKQQVESVVGHYLDLL
jgi:nucleoside-diphosphate-sugar epimerase